MNILLLGSGGREHAMAHKIAQSRRCSHLFIAPGNAGTTNCGTNVNLDPCNFEEVAEFVKKRDINMVVVGPEAPLVEGIVDYFAATPDLEKVMIIGPGKAGAQLEGSKDFAKKFMSDYHIPTAEHFTVIPQSLDEGLAYLETIPAPYVLKADGLAAGKGVLILDTLEEAKRELTSMLMENKFGKASEKVVIEQYLKGVELSVFVLTDGRHYHILPTAKDYKRIGEGDTGPNTGGMGSISPVHFADKAFMRKVERRIVVPTIRGLYRRNLNYKGFIFIGLMAVPSENGFDPYVIEYNVRMGDPETESVFPRIESDIVDLFEHVWHSELHHTTLEVSSKSAACVMMVSEGYPGSYPKGKVIQGLERRPADPDTFVFHAGTSRNAQGDYVTNGGRVVCVTSLADNIPSAMLRTYQYLDIIKWEGSYYRRDIGQDLLKMMM